MKNKVVLFTDDNAKLYINPSEEEIQKLKMIGKVIQNPDLRAVQGISPQKWKLDGNKIIADHNKKGPSSTNLNKETYSEKEKIYKRLLATEEEISLRRNQFDTIRIEQNDLRLNMKTMLTNQKEVYDKIQRSVDVVDEKYQDLIDELHHNFGLIQEDIETIRSKKPIITYQPENKKTKIFLLACLGLNLLLTIINIIA